MTSSKLGILGTQAPLGILPSSVLAAAVALAPIHVAFAAPPVEGEGDEISVGDPGDEGDEISVGDPGDEGDEISVGDPGDEGDEISVGGDDEGDEISVGGDDEGDEIAVGEDEGEGEGEDEAEDEGDEMAIEPPPDLADAGPIQPPEPTWGPKGQYPRNGKGMLITGGIVTGLGAAFIVTSVLITQCDFESSLKCKYGDQRDFLIPTAVATTGLGLLLVGVGIGNRIKYKRWQNWTPEQTAVVPTYVPGGGGVAWVGQF
jgi:hypothetical protein